MNYLAEHFKLIYLVVVAGLLLLSWYFMRKAQYDERRKNRYGIKSIKRNIRIYRKRLENEEFDLFFKKNGLPKWITSERLNLVRFSILIGVLVIVIYGLITRTNYIDITTLFLWGIIPIALTPKKPYPMHFIVMMFQKKRQNEISNEIYQLYNDLKSAYQVGDKPKSSYYLIQEALPYFKVIRPSLEKMLPLLEVKNNGVAWDQFANELNTKEAETLGVVMKEVESLKTEQAYLLLEQKRREFSNDLYNRYTEILRKRKSIIYVLVVVGALTVFLNEVTVFFMWYKEVMAVVNQMG
ncbi:hypothetical protein [Psychrobacillus sp. FSL H8-0487]|uniref:hypothetical protein n=1 Tax=Psychrobacillus sp. FSL H8-0487 TaxID=2921391 RepID=UPI0030F8E72A